MAYTDQIQCPHCKNEVKVEVDIEGSGDDVYANINPLPLTEEEKLVKLFHTIP